MNRSGPSDRNPTVVKRSRGRRSGAHVTETTATAGGSGEDGGDAPALLLLPRHDGDVLQTPLVTAQALLCSAAALEDPIDDGDDVLSSETGGVPMTIADALVHRLQEEKIGKMRKLERKVRDKVRRSGVVRRDGDVHLFELNDGGRRRKFDLQPRSI